MGQEPLVYLASQSPRRRILLDQLGVRYQVLAVAVDETPRDNEGAQVFVTRLARAKAEAALPIVAVHDSQNAESALRERARPTRSQGGDDDGEQRWRRSGVNRAGDPRSAGGTVMVLAADTAVVIDDQILGKPRDRDDGLAMLERLAGRTHQVLTGVALLGNGRDAVAVNRSRVRFRTISTAEAAAYWATGEPCDKAGAYAIQGLGALFVAKIAGSYSGIMGLPLFETANLLAGAGIQLLPPQSN